eukprot:6187066-Pleurochrysis_carterae.AAC.3
MHGDKEADRYQMILAEKQFMQEAVYRTLTVRTAFGRATIAMVYLSDKKHLNFKPAQIERAWATNLQNENEAASRVVAVVQHVRVAVPLGGGGVRGVGREEQVMRVDEREHVRVVRAGAVLLPS